MKPYGRLVLAFVLSLALSGCVPADITPIATGEPAFSNLGRLSVQAVPDGALLTVDGVEQGVSPLVVDLAPGDHQVVLSAEGYQTLTETLTLEAGQEGLYSPTLMDGVPPQVAITADPLDIPWDGASDVRASASDDSGISALEIWLGDQQLGVAESDEVALTLAPDSLASVEPGGVYTLTARAIDGSGNSGEASIAIQLSGAPVAVAVPTESATATAVPSPTPEPAPTAAPAVSPTPSEPTKMTVTEVTIPTYPYDQYTSTITYDQMGDYPLIVLDRAAYEASNPQPVAKSYRLIVIENEYIRLSILPDLGGRIYECVFKPTGNNELYQNPVIKPTQWGPSDSEYPAGANWWLAAGGIEFGFPVEEHGFEWGAKWGYDHVNLDDGGVTVNVFMRDFKRPYAVVDITLRPGQAFFTIEPRIVNPWGSTFRFKWWIDAMVAPGAANEPSSDLRFVFPVEQMAIHSTGDESLPEAGATISWPVYGGRDLSQLGNWDRYLGFFESPAASGDFMGVYDPSANEGLMRIFPSNIARGAKGFAFGWSNPVDSGDWTDDGSGYVEMQGGLLPNYDEWYELQPGEQVKWSETWYPVAGIGGVTAASGAAAINLTVRDATMELAIYPTQWIEGTLEITVAGQAPIQQPVALEPAQAYAGSLPLGADVPDEGEIRVRLLGGSGEVYLDHSVVMSLR